jgi:hypothetical protein
MRGPASIENTRSHDAARSAADAIKAFLAVCAVGVLAGLVAGQVRVHVGLPGHKAIFAAGLAGAAANLVLLAERLLTPLFQWHAFLGLSAQGARLLFYAAFGLLAGLLGAGLAAVICRRRHGLHETTSPRP